MITPEQYLEIQNLRQCGFSYAKVAAKLNLAENTVIKYDKEGYVATKRSRKKSSSKLDPFKKDILRWLSEHPDLSSVQIEHRLRQEGYDGGNTIIKDYLRTIRPKSRRAFLKLYFPPGDSMQVDWGEAGTIIIDGVNFKVYFFVAVMSHSRAIYTRFTRRMSMEFWLECHRFAFEYFGGVPKRVIVDNCKTAVIKNKRGLKPELNETYVDFARHYGFTITPCNVRQPQEKGRGENGVGYVRKSFIVGRNLAPFEALNPDAVIWMNEVANVRKHGTTGKIPFEELEAERSLLTKLNLPYDCSVVESVKANSLCRVRIDCNDYSVSPDYVGKQLIVRRGTQTIRIFDGERLIVSHQRSFIKKDDIEAPEHAERLIAGRHRAAADKRLSMFLKLTPVAEEFYRELKAKRFNPDEHIRKILALVEIHGAEEVIVTLKDALRLKTCGSAYIENILEQRDRFRKRREPGTLHITHKKEMLDMDGDDPDIGIYDKKAGF